MPFCSQCGNPVSAQDIFCYQCGSRQPVEAPPRSEDWLAGISPRTAAVLCYVPVVGWIAAVVVLATNRFRGDRTLRFHAFQGLYLFVAWLIVSEVISPLLHPAIPVHFIGGLLHAMILFLWIFMIVKASQDEVYSLPIIGELAERSVAEH